MKSFKTYLILVFLAVASFGLYHSLSPEEDKLVLKEDKKKDPVENNKGQKAKQTMAASTQSKEIKSFDPEQAIQTENHAKILEFIDQGRLDVDHKNEAGMTLLMQALDYDQPQLAYELIERGADLQAFDKTGTQILTQALLLGETKITRMALEKGANAKTQLDLIGSSLLMYAAQEGLNEEIELLIDHGADVNHQNQRGETALMWASDMGQFQTAELLLKYNADKRLKNQAGLSARDMALKRGLNKLAQILRP